jgi:2'-5' RNA ligase
MLACLLLPAAAAGQVVSLQRRLASYRPLLPPHLTLLPPARDPAEAGPLAAALEQAAARAPALHLTIGPAATFLPAEPVVYLRVGGDDAAALRALHDELSAAMARPAGEYPFVPHVTLVRGLEPPLLHACLAAAQAARWEVVVRTAHLVSMSRRGDVWSWRTAAHYPLAG